MVLRQDEAAARAYAGRFHAPEVGCDLRGNAADRADVHLIDLRRCKRLVALVGLERFRQGRPFEPVGGIALRFRRCGLLLRAERDNERDRLPVLELRALIDVLPDDDALGLVAVFIGNARLGVQLRKLRLG